MSGSHELVQQTTTTSASADLVSVFVENLVGQRVTVRVGKAVTVRQLKEEIEAQTRIKAVNQTLVRRGAESTPGGGYAQLDDTKTLDEYKFNDGERVLLIPSMKAAPPGYETLRKDSVPAQATKVFMDPEGGTTVSTFIDKALADKNQKRDPNSIYLLVQFPGQAQDSYTIVRYEQDVVPKRAGRPPSKKQQRSRSSAESVESNNDNGNNGPTNGIDQPDEHSVIIGSAVKSKNGEAALIERKKQNDNTHNKMKKLRATLEKLKLKKKKKPAVVEMNLDECHDVNTRCLDCGSLKCRCTSFKSLPSSLVNSAPNEDQTSAKESEKSSHLPPFSTPRKANCSIS